MDKRQTIEEEDDESFGYEREISASETSAEAGDAEGRGEAPVYGSLRAAKTAPQGERSWFFFSLSLVALSILLDYVLVSLGSALFFSDRVVYTGSIILRGAAVTVVLLFLERRFFNDALSLYVVTGTVGLVSGTVLACSRFISDFTFWTFLNVFIEPIDNALLALAGAYVVHTLRGSSHFAATKQSSETAQPPLL